MKKNRFQNQKNDLIISDANLFKISTYQPTPDNALNRLKMVSNQKVLPDKKALRLASRLGLLRFSDFF